MAEQLKWHKQPSIVPMPPVVTVVPGALGLGSVLAVQLDDAVVRFLEDKGFSNLAPSSIDEYRTQLNVFSRWLLSRQVSRTDEISGDQIRSYLAERKRTCGQSSLCHQRSILHLWVEWMADHHMTRVNPKSIPKVAPPKDDEVRRIHLSDRDVQRFLSSLTDAYKAERRQGGSGYIPARNLAVVGLLFGVGMRISEVVAMKSGDINWRDRELRIPVSKSSKRRDVVIPRRALCFLRLYNRIRALAQVKTQWFFVSRMGSPYKPTTLARIVQKQGAKVNITLTSHVGRRYCITRLAAINPYAAKQQAGHADLQTTLVYVHEDRRALHQAMDASDPLL